VGSIIDGVTCELVVNEKARGENCEVSSTTGGWCVSGVPRILVLGRVRD